MTDKVHRRRLVGVGAFALIAGLASAQEPEVRQGRAHVHGAWDLFAALDGDVLRVTLLGPLADLIGDEPAIGSPEEAAALADLNAALMDQAPLVEFNDRAECRVDGPGQARVIQTADAEHDYDHGEHDHDHAEHDHDHGEHENDHAEHDHDHGEHDHDHDEHDHDHAEHNHDHAEHDHDHAEHDHDHDQAGHSHGGDVEIVYAFSCGRSERLSALTVDAFETYAGIETIDAVFLGDGRQAADRLTASQTRLSLD
ncbi:MAG: DUF2796 domain-containing protein [Maricaulaceae bacterium]